MGCLHVCQSMFCSFLWGIFFGNMEFLPPDNFERLLPWTCIFFSIHELMRSLACGVFCGHSSQPIKKIKSDRENGLCKECLAIQQSTG